MGELTSGSCLGQEEPIKMQVVIEQRRVQDDTVGNIRRWATAGAMEKVTSRWGMA